MFSYSPSPTSPLTSLYHLLLLITFTVSLPSSILPFLLLLLFPPPLPLFPLFLVPPFPPLLLVCYFTAFPLFTRSCPFLFLQTTTKTARLINNDTHTHKRLAHKNTIRQTNRLLQCRQTNGQIYVDTDKYPDTNKDKQPDTCRHGQTARHVETDKRPVPQRDRQTAKHTQ